MKRLLVLFMVAFLAVEALGQQSVDIGIMGGAGTYFGDMTKMEMNKSINPAYGGFLRFNFNPRYALRFNVINGTMGAQGEFESKYWDFNKNVLDISLHFEFNYLKYIVGNRETHWSTYLFGGLGMQTYTYKRDDARLSGIVDPSYFANADFSGSVISPTIPFGLGFKYNLSRRWGIALEGGLRKSFSDKLDDLDDPLSYLDNQGIQVKYTDQFHNNDWTSYTTVHLVYKVIYGNKDWELKTPKRNILDWGIWNKDRKE